MLPTTMSDTTAFTNGFFSLQQNTTASYTQSYFFHDIHLLCHTNDLAIQTALDTLLTCFPAAHEQHGALHCYITCYDSKDQFPLPIPADARQIDTLQLVTDTTLSLYMHEENHLLYQYYAPQTACNGTILTVLSLQQQTAFIQLERAELYTPAFLRRYVFLLAIGELLHNYGFVPYHAAALSAPDDDNYGVLIPGDSGSGKTTLSLSCASTTYGLLGDDLVLLRLTQPATLSVYAILPEVSVRTPSLALLPRLAFLQATPADQRDKRYCAIEQLRAGAMRFITQPRLLLFPTLTEAENHTAHALSQATALHYLIQQSISRAHTTRATQEQLFSLLTTLTMQATSYRVQIARGRDDLPAFIRSLIDR